MALIRLYILLGLLGGTAMEGFAPRYSPNKMPHVADLRGLEHAPCMVSSAYYDIGVWLWVWGKNTYTLRHCKVVDVSGPADKARHRRTKRLIELDHAVAFDICGNMGRPTDCPVIVFRINE